jgi:Cu/Ag efflux protein CusF
VASCWFKCGAHLDGGAGLAAAITELCAGLAAFVTGTNAAIATCRAYPTKPESSMSIAKIIFAGTTTLAILGSAALAQDAATGTVTKVDRINGVIAIQQTQSGTVGANSGGTAQDYKPQDGALLNTLHAGDRVTFSATEAGGVNTITKLEKR